MDLVDLYGFQGFGLPDGWILNIFKDFAHWDDHTVGFKQNMDFKDLDDPTNRFSRFH